MGLFDWLKPQQSNIQIVDELIWLTKKAKYAGIAEAIKGSLNEPSGLVAILAVAHFQDCLNELIQTLKAQGLDDRRLLILPAEDLKGAPVSMTTVGESCRIDILLGERHPLPSHDEAVVEFSESLPCRCHLVHHVSLEDPLMRMFGGEWVESILNKLGMSEDEPIESRMVARRIQAAQKKVESQAVGDMAADSAERWFELNCPEFWRKHSQT